MGLFPSANDFKAGKGVEKDAPRKTGVGRFFELVGRDMNSMFLANLLTCLGFVPVISLVYIGFLMNNLWAASWPGRCWPGCTTPCCAPCATRPATGG